MHIHKTGALIRAAVLLGFVLRDAARKRRSRSWTNTPRPSASHSRSSTTCSTTDASTATLGKTAGKDSKQGKPTYVSAIGLPQARELRRGAARAGARGARRPRRGAARRLRRAGRFHRSAEILAWRRSPTSCPPTAAIRRCTSCCKTINDPAELRALERRQLRPARRRAARLRARVGVEDRRPPVVQPRHGRAHHRAALRVRYARGPHRLGRRPPDLRRTRSSPGGARRWRACACSTASPASRAAAESKYDTFGTAHSVTSISAALGMAVGGKDKKREAPLHRGDRRRRDVGRHGLRGDEQRRRDGRRPAGDPQRQRDVDLAAGRRADQLPRAPALGPHVLDRASARASTCSSACRRLGARAARRGARQGHGHALDAVRGVRLQLHRPDRRPRPRRADPDARQHQEAEAGRSSCTSSRARARATSWPRRTRSPTTARASSIPPKASRSVRRRQAHLSPDLRRLAVRHGGARPRLVAITPAMREGSGMVRYSENVPGALLRRRHRRAARGDLRRAASPARA